MKTKIVSILCVLIMLASMLLLVSCNNVEVNQSIQSINTVDEVQIILNGHISDNRDNSKLVTPCAIKYDNVIYVINTQCVYGNDNILDPHRSTSRTDDCQKKYMCVVVAVINASKYDAMPSMFDFQLYIDNSPVEMETMYNSDDSPYLTSLSSGRHDVICGFFPIPNKGANFELEFNPIGISHKVVFFTSLKENVFIDEDMEYIENHW